MIDVIKKLYFNAQTKAANCNHEASVFEKKAENLRSEARAYNDMAIRIESAMNEQKTKEKEEQKIG